MQTVKPWYCVRGTGFSRVMALLSV